MTRIQELEKFISDARKAYYGVSDDIMANNISDAEYDAAEAELRELDPDNHLFSEVGADTNENRERLSAPMLSQEKALTKEDTLKIIASRFPDSEQVVITEKLDGCGLDLTYVNGKLVSAITRGTWIEGTQVIEQAKLVEDIPHILNCPDLKEVIHVRGEVVINFKDFDELNSKREAQGLEKFSNPRNLAAGTIKITDLKEVKERKLRFVAYEMFEGSDLYSQPCKTEKLSNYSKLVLLDQLGFTIPLLSCVRDNAKESVDYCYNAFKLEYPYPIDGVVVKLADIEEAKKLGETSHHPKGSFAIKPLAESTWVTIDHLDWTLSRRGVLSPTAVFEPVMLSGASISRVMLFNLNNLERFNAYPGTRLKIVRSGLVIPKAVGSDYHVERYEPFPVYDETHTSIQVEDGKYAVYDKTKIKEFYPKEFEGKKVTEVEQSVGGARVLMVDSEGDLTVAARRVQHFLSAIRCLGFGEAILTELCENAGIQNLVQFLDAFNADFVRNNIHSRVISVSYALKLEQEFKKAMSEADMKSVLLGLGIDKAVKIIDSVVEKANRREDLWDLNLWRGLTTPGIFKYIEEYFNNNMDLFKNVVSRFEFVKEVKSEGSSLTGHSFVITGTMPVKRSEIEKFIKDNGGLVQSAVSSRTTCLIAGENCGSKLDAAKKLGTQIISFEEFRSKFGY